MFLLMRTFAPPEGIPLHAASYAIFFIVFYFKCVYVIHSHCMYLSKMLHVKEF